LRREGGRKGRKEGFYYIYHTETVKSVFVGVGVGGRVEGGGGGGEGGGGRLQFDELITAAAR